MSDVPTTPTPEDALTQLQWAIAEIVGRETLDDAIIAAKYAGLGEKAMKELKDSIRELIAKMLTSTGQAKYQTPFATVGWTDPKEPEDELDKDALLAAAKRDPALAATLKPYMRPGKQRQSTLYIK